MIIINVVCAWMAAVFLCQGQTAIHLGQQGKSADFGSMTHTRPVQTGTALPATCSVGELFFHSGSTEGDNLRGCVGANTWQKLTGMGGCTVGSGGVLSCPVRLEAGGGGEAGELQLLEKTIQGTDYISLLAPDSITSTYRLRLPAGAPADQVLVFAAPANGVAAGSWVPRSTKVQETQFFPTARRLGSEGWGVGPDWSIPESDGASVNGGGTAPFRAGYLVFPPAVKNNALLTARIPAGWDGSAITAKLVWAAPNGGTGTNVKWQASVACVEDGQDLMQPGFAAAMEITVAIPYAEDAAAKKITSQFPESIWSGCTAESVVYVLLSRDGSADTNAMPVHLMGVQLNFMKGLE